VTATRTRRLAGGVLLLTLPLAACTGGGDGGGSGAASGASGPGAAPVTRWWGGQADYCSVLRSTVAAGRSILPGVGADDPARLASTKAFVAELQKDAQKDAPSSVSGAWHVLGPAVVKIVASGGNLRSVKGIDPAAVQRAATTVATHAKQACHVDVSGASPR